ncbi:DUF2283 domain-containing protein [Curtobacterium sp. MCSS17_016]|uniref:DUF2283 domain-containing protein n=1 Tax=Curtobacterium sp. MCSS17_016 TaxID=2175644 RepID=UPI000DA77909|nr:DUF2283 domain-containing protein [Curtobacterium sp. MCSS17_016]WIE81392.1 DUF2283 domain-containing protein [Curtobacterium sp. MCSS17_016]
MGEQTTLTVTVTPDLGVGYFRLTDHDVAVTRDVGGGLLVDYDAVGAVVGVETLTLDEHISPTVLALLTTKKPA